MQCQPAPPVGDPGAEEGGRRWGGEGLIQITNRAQDRVSPSISALAKTHAKIGQSFGLSLSVCPGGGVHIVFVLLFCFSVTGLSSQVETELKTESVIPTGKSLDDGVATPTLLLSH